MKHIIALAFFLLTAFSSAFAHTPLMICYNNGDGTITCEGGFSDGSSASGVKMTVLSDSGRVLISGEMNENATFTFPIPKGNFKTIFDAGQGHSVEIRGSEIGS